MTTLYVVFENEEDAIQAVAQFRPDLAKDRIRQALGIFMRSRTDVLKTDTFDIKVMRSKRGTPRLTVHFRDESLAIPALTLIGNRSLEHLDSPGSRSKCRGSFSLVYGRVPCWIGKKRISKARPSAGGISDLDEWIRRIESGQKLPILRSRAKHSNTLSERKVWNRVRKAAMLEANRQRRNYSAGSGPLMGQGQVSEPYSSGAPLPGTYRSKR